MRSFFAVDTSGKKSKYNIPNKYASDVTFILHHDRNTRNSALSYNYDEHDFAHAAVATEVPTLQESRLIA